MAEGALEEGVEKVVVLLVERLFAGFLSVDFFYLFCKLVLELFFRYWHFEL